MGSLEDEKGHQVSEEPQHLVGISRPFYLSRFPITQREWESVTGTNPSKFRDNDLLRVESISWDDCQEFIYQLNHQEGGEQYCLPTEAQWEYACRAKSQKRFSSGNTLTLDKANYDETHHSGNRSSNRLSRRRTTPVGLFAPNAWGLFDMHGNVWKWCQDRYNSNYYQKSPSIDPQGPEQGSTRVIRGGSWFNNASFCRSATRGSAAQSLRYSYLGLRLARTLE